MAFTALDVKKLREMTNVGMMDCKKALTETDGDMDKAVEWLREKGLAKAAKKENPGNASDHKPGSCAHCLYYRPDFKYRRCQFTRCPYGKDKDVFRKKPLKRDKFS